MHCIVKLQTTKVLASSFLIKEELTNSEKLAGGWQIEQRSHLSQTPTHFQMVLFPQFVADLMFSRISQTSSHARLWNLPEKSSAEASRQRFCTHRSSLYQRGLHSKMSAHKTVTVALIKSRRWVWRLSSHLTEKAKQN